MCGIVGYVGEKKCTPILINGLKNLEYRGYDSAGIAVMEQNHIEVVKEKGRVKNLEDILSSTVLNGTIGIAHTRWATHGKPSKDNSHPHKDNSNTFAVVHNGIIENYKELRMFLEDSNYTFYSQTDTEVIPNLIHYYYSKYDEKTKDNFLKSVIYACNELRGSYAILVLCNDFPNMEIVAKKDSPLVIGKGTNEYYIASDIPAVLNYTKDFYFLDDNNFATIEENEIHFYDSNNIELNKDLKSISWDCTSSSKRGYDDFMIKEIFEQPEAIKRTIINRINLGKICNFSDINLSRKYLSAIDKIYIVACGTAMHAGLVGKYAIEKLAKIPTITEIASEFRYQNPLIDKNTLCIFISQSGETADTIAALKLAKQKNCKTLAITNVIGSSITREADFSIYTEAGPEIAVASTKAYTCQVALLCCFAIYLSEVLKRENTNLLENLKQELLCIPEKIETILKNCDVVEDVANKVYLEKDMFFLGRGIDYTTCLEGSLKLKEISYIHSEAYSAGELKHGPIALIENNITVVGILTDENLIEKSVSNLQEVITRGAKTFVVCNDENVANRFDYSLVIPSTYTYLSPLLSIVPLQLLSYYITKEKGLDVDKPRNLAKSVTVE
ncbi:MAG: glutamine--fructose-6-phosphate transaminase (isomerizing) [Clostridiaceae bacterium]|nr:glutamine--fructose-6-phosphate transaminase (isomerizing) [Clostridiaceae bacterium]